MPRLMTPFQAQLVPHEKEFLAFTKNRFRGDCRHADKYWLAPITEPSPGRGASGVSRTLAVNPCPPMMAANQEKVRDAMKTELVPAMKLTITVGEDERRAHHPLYREVLVVLHKTGIVGATLTKGVMSYGVQRRLHTIKNEIQMENLPIIIEAVDERVRIERASLLVAELLGEHGLVEIQHTMVARKETVEQERRER